MKVKVDSAFKADLLQHWYVLRHGMSELDRLRAVRGDRQRARHIVGELRQWDRSIRQVFGGPQRCLRHQSCREHVYQCLWCKEVMNG